MCMKWFVKFDQTSQTISCNVQKKDMAGSKIQIDYNIKLLTNALKKCRDGQAQFSKELIDRFL